MKNMNQALSLIIIASLLLSSSQKLVNPIIPGFHPDPSIVRVGDDYYIVNSSFQYFPGVPIFHSKDLINWEQIGNVLDRPTQLPLKGTTSWSGIYAPTIRYYKGTFYMITTNIGNAGNFLVTAEDPEGPWSEPKWLEQGGIDPSLYFEDDKVYMVSNPDNTITLCEIDPKSGKRLTPGKPLWRGLGGRYPEGPHIYKKDGYYYLLISEGGTELAHHLTIARSKDIYGPYEANPNNPILTNCNMKGQSLMVQGTGHGDFVKAKDGSWWVVFLAYRHYGGAYHHLGRETFLAPVEWKEGEWPVVNGNNAINITMDVSAPEKRPKPKRDKNILKESFDWLYIQNPIEENYKFEDGRLTMTASKSTLTENDCPSFLGRRQESPTFYAETEISIRRLSDGVSAGLTLYQINDGHFDLFLRNVDDNISLVFRYTIKSLVGEKVIKIKDDSIERIKLRISSDGEKYYFDDSVDGGEKYLKVDEQVVSLLSTEVVGGFTGVIIGMFAEGEGTVQFRYFDYNEDE